MKSDNLPDDISLASGLRKGDREAFALFFNKYRKPVYYFSLKYLNDPAEAEELVQSVFLSIWEHRHLIDKKKSLKNYLYKSVANAVFNALRKRAIRRAYLIKGISNPESVTDPYVQIFNNDLKDRLDDMISYLPPKQQLILNYRRQEGLSSEEIAKKLNLSVRTVDNQIYKATKRLKDFFRSETE
ncbi:MAG: RNA polymerase sigma-70 factor [Bacteroidales bacterium]|nr:RNA polymerase sigma-70 factor [Bacteroidales bacterium]